MRAANVLSRFSPTVGAIALILMALAGSVPPTIRIVGYNIWSTHIWWVLGLVLAVYIASKYDLDDLHWFITAPLVPLVAFGALAVLSIIWAVDFGEAVRGAYHIGTGLLIIAVFAIITYRYRRSEILVTALTAVVLLCLVISFWELATGNHLPTSRPDRVDWHRTSALFWNRNDYALFLALTAPLILRDAIREREARPRLYMLTALAIIVYLLWDAGARTALIGTLGALVTLRLFATQVEQIRDLVPEDTPVWTGVIAAGAITVILLPLIFPNPFNISSFWTRWQLIEVSHHLILDHPLGVGIGNFATAAEGVTAVETNGRYQPHNWVIQIYGELGLIGLGLFVLFLGGMLDRLFRLAVNGDLLAAALFSGLVWFPITGVGPSDALMTNSVMWIYFGVTLSHLALAGKRRSNFDLNVLPETSNT